MQHFGYDVRPDRRIIYVYFLEEYWESDKCVVRGHSITRKKFNDRITKWVAERAGEYDEYLHEWHVPANLLEEFAMTWDFWTVI